MNVPKLQIIVTRMPCVPTQLDRLHVPVSLDILAMERGVKVIYKIKNIVHVIDNTFVTSFAKYRFHGIFLICQFAYRLLSKISHLI